MWEYVPHGFGEMTSDLFRYIGDFKNGDFCGNGKYEDLKTNMVYTGEFFENKKHGDG